MKHNPHSIQITQIAHQIITHMNSLIQNFYADDESWKVSASLLKYDAEHLQLHFNQHLKLVEAQKGWEE